MDPVGQPPARLLVVGHQILQLALVEPQAAAGGAFVDQYPLPGTYIHLIHVAAADGAGARLLVALGRQQVRDGRGLEHELQFAPVEPDALAACAQIEFDRNIVPAWPWPGISVTDLAVSDISRHNGAAVEVFNPADKPVWIRFALFTPYAFPSDLWGCLTRDVPAKGSTVFAFTDVTKPVAAVSFAAVRPPDPVVRVYVTPVYLITK